MEATLPTLCPKHASSEPNGYRTLWRWTVRWWTVLLMTFRWRTVPTTELPKNVDGIIRSLMFKITVSVLSYHIASE